MTAQEFNDWIEKRGISGREAARQLGLSKGTVVRYRATGAPLVVALACAALDADLSPWGKDDDD